MYGPCARSEAAPAVPESTRSVSSCGRETDNNNDSNNNNNNNNMIN